MGSQGSSESCATTNNNTKCEKTRRKLENNTNTPAALPQRTLRGTTNKKARTEPSGQASKKAPRAPAGPQTVSFVVINSQKFKIKIKTAQIKRFFRF
jgi:hypothetical protein